MVSPERASRISSSRYHSIDKETNMPGERISDGPRKAQRVRSIVEAKENFVWATTMEGLCDIFEMDNLGARLSEEMTVRLREVGVRCYPDPLPSQQQRSTVLMLEHSRFAQGFEPKPGRDD
jgi:hypothetical protein